MAIQKINVTATISAEKNKVWDYYTRPEHIIQWNFADPSWHCPAASNDLKTGGRYYARMEAKDGSIGFDFEAEYIEVTPELSFTFQFGMRLATVEFIDNKDKTLVSITFDPETENPVELQRNGWQAILNNFKKYTENR